jgi:hypothetical protein
LSIGAIDWSSGNSDCCFIGDALHGQQSGLVLGWVSPTSVGEGSASLEWDVVDDSAFSNSMTGSLARLHARITWHATVRS